MSLLDGAGHELPQKLHPVEFVFELGEPGAVPDLTSRSGR